MLSAKVFFGDMDPLQWRRLTELAYVQRQARRGYLLHEEGKPVKLYDSRDGELPLPPGLVTDAQQAAQELYKAHPGWHEVWVVDPDAFRRALARVQSQASQEQDLDDYALAEFEARTSAQGCAVWPPRELIWHGLPLRRIQNFVKRMLPPSCIFVLGVFDGEELWICLLVEFEHGQVVSLRTSLALPAEDLADLRGRDQHPFLLAVAANFFRRPAFGWFLERPDFEAWMLEPDAEAKAELFQRGLMENRATFDYSALLNRHITAFSPLNPGSSAVAGQNREANPRLRAPDPWQAGPSAF